MASHVRFSGLLLPLVAPMLLGACVSQSRPVCRRVDMTTWQHKISSSSSKSRPRERT
jgi:hypothetical protein